MGLFRLLVDPHRIVRATEDGVPGMMYVAWGLACNEVIQSQAGTSWSMIRGYSRELRWTYLSTARPRNKLFYFTIQSKNSHRNPNRFSSLRHATISGFGRQGAAGLMSPSNPHIRRSTKKTCPSVLR